MKVKYLIKNLLCISCIFCFTTCRKYKTTTINGKLINMATGKGIANNKIVLNAYSLSGGKLPKKVASQLETITDNNGNYSFIFDAFTTKNNKKEVSYGVEMVNEKYFTLTQLSDVISKQKNSFVDLTKTFNCNLLPIENIDNLGGDNNIELKVVLAGRFFFQFFNINNNDSMHLLCSNQFLEYTLSEMGAAPEPDNSWLESYPFFLVTGENILRKMIYKNGQISLIDTTIYIEPKDYHINFNY